jgi:hypothetical protein
MERCCGSGAVGSEIARTIRDRDAGGDVSLPESSWVFYAGQPINELATEQTAETAVDRKHFWQRKPRLMPPNSPNSIECCFVRPSKRGSVQSQCLPTIESFKPRVFLGKIFC